MGEVLSLSGLSRMPLRYHGGKWRLAPWIISHFPEHVCYVEPFAGGASVLLRKPISPIEVYNDMDSSVVNFFRVLREQPEALCRDIELTPWSREELEEARQDCEDHLEWARRRYVRSFQSRSQTSGAQSPGWKFNHSLHGAQVVSLWNDPSHLMLAAARMKEVHIEHDDAMGVIHRYDTEQTLFYVDPPYIKKSRSRTWSGRAYLHEMDDDEHAELAKRLHACKGMVVLSGYPSELYDELYSDWSCVFKEVTDGGGKRRQECLWMNPAVTEKQRQTSLFSQA